MKNLYLLPTENPSRLYRFGGELLLSEEPVIAFGNNDIYIISDEKPKAGDWSLYQNKIHKCIEDIVGDEFKKIILTTDQDLIKDGIQLIDDEFLEWFVDNSNCKLVELYNKKILIPIDKSKQRDLIIQIMQEDEEYGLYVETKEKILYSKDDVLDILHKRMLDALGNDYEEQTTIDWFEKLK